MTVTADGKASLRVQASSSSRVDVVRGFVEGRNVFEKAVCASSANLTVDVPLLPGSNVVTFAAFDDCGAASNLTRAEVKTDRDGAKLAGAKSAPDLHVVAIGVNRYPKLPPSMQPRRSRAPNSLKDRGFQGFSKGR